MNAGQDALDEFLARCRESWDSSTNDRQIELLREREAILTELGLDTLPGESWSIELGRGSSLFLYLRQESAAGAGIFLGLLRERLDRQRAAFHRGDMDQVLAIDAEQAPFIRYAHIGGTH